MSLHSTPATDQKKWLDEVVKIDKISALQNTRGFYIASPNLRSWLQQLTEEKLKEATAEQKKWFETLVEEEDYWAKHQYRISTTNNQLTIFLPLCKSNSGLYLGANPLLPPTIENLGSKGIYRVRNLFPEETARGFRDYALRIPFSPETTAPLDDANNPPLKCTTTTGSKQWRWEYYCNKSIWRAAPESLTAFENSRLHILVASIIEFWQRVDKSNMTWFFVLQRQVR